MKWILTGRRTAFRVNCFIQKSHRRCGRLSGPLADATALKAEQQALADLFAGAIGSYKNPHSHRSVTIESTEATEMIVLASHLLGIVDKRSSNER